MDEKSLQNKHSTLLKRQKLLLNEKLIFTHYFNRVSEEEKKRSFTFEDYMKERLKDEKKISLLDIGKKYDVVHSELQNAHIKWENFEKKKDEKTDELLAQNQEVISHIKDIKMEVYELNRKIDTQSENKNGKISYDVFKKFFEDKFKKLENMIKKYKDNIESLNKQIVVATKKIEKKDSNNELQFIDFHQLQIENKKYVKEVDEKNKLLLKLKMTIGKITQDKNNYKKKLNDELQQLAENKKEIKRNILDKQKIKEMTAKQDKVSEERDKETNMLHNKLSKGGTLEINHHVKEKNIEKELVHILVNLKKKLNDELQQLAENKKEIKRNILDKEKIKKMTIRQDEISEERDKETNMLHNKLSKGGTLEINHHVKEKNIEKELVHILVNLKKKLEIEKIKVNQTTNYI